MKVRSDMGFSLVELLISVLVVGVLASIAMPSLRELRVRAQLQATQSELITSLAYARSQALFLGQRVAICPSDDGFSCRRDRRWESGYLVFQDGNHNRRRDGDEPILSQGPYRPEVQVQASAGRPMVIYHPNGGAYGYNVTLRLCSAIAQHSSRVIVSNPGRARIARGGGC